MLEVGEEIRVVTSGWLYNKKGKIIFIKPAKLPKTPHMILVEFNESNPEFHNGNGYYKGKDKHCWFVSPSSLELVQETDYLPIWREPKWDNQELEEEEL